MACFVDDHYKAFRRSCIDDDDAEDDRDAVVGSGGSIGSKAEAAADEFYC